MIPQPFTEEEVADGVWQLSGTHNWGSGVNAVALVSGKRVLVVDNLYQPRDARRMFRTLERRGLRPEVLVNTHWHTDHTVANCLYGCPIWAHVTGPKLLREYWPQWVGDTEDPRAGGLWLKEPDHLFHRRATLDFAGEEVQLLHLPGHTPDSIGVFLPDRRIFIAGDTVMDIPFIIFGNSFEEIRSLHRVQRLRPRLILQGHGGPCSVARVGSDIRYLLRVRDEARKARRAGISKEEFLKTPLERVLAPGRCRTLPEGCINAHRGNLEKIWTEVSSPR